MTLNHSTVRVSGVEAVRALETALRTGESVTIFNAEHKVVEIVIYTTPQGVSATAELRQVKVRE